MKKILALALFAVALVSCRQTMQTDGFKLSGHLEGLQVGDTLFLKTFLLPDWKEDEKNAIRYYKKYMATVPEDQRYALDEDGNPVEDRITLYQQAWKRIKKIKEEGFFRGDIPTKSFPVEKKDTLALRHAK